MTSIIISVAGRPTNPNNPIEQTTEANTIKTPENIIKTIDEYVLLCFILNGILEPRKYFKESPTIEKYIWFCFVLLYLQVPG